MTVTLVKPPARWGVEFEGSPNPDHVDIRANEADARRFAHALQFCGNRPCVVVDDGHGWHPAVTQ